MYANMRTFILKKNEKIKGLASLPALSQLQTKLNLAIKLNLNN